MMRVAPELARIYHLSWSELYDMPGDVLAAYLDDHRRLVQEEQRAMRGR